MGIGVTWGPFNEQNKTIAGEMPGPEVCRALMELVTAEASDLKRKKKVFLLYSSNYSLILFLFHIPACQEEQSRECRLVSYSCNIGSVDRVGLGDSAQLQNAYLQFSVGLPWVTNAMQSSGQLCKAWCQKRDRRAASGIIQLSFCGGRGCLMVGKRSKRGSQNGCHWGVLGGESSCCRRHQGSLQEETPQRPGVETSLETGAGGAPEGKRF